MALQPKLSAVGPCSWITVTANPKCFPSLHQCYVPPPPQTAPAATATQHSPHGMVLAGVAHTFCQTREGRRGMREHRMGMLMGGCSPPIPLWLPGGLLTRGRACFLLLSFGGLWDAAPSTHSSVREPAIRCAPSLRLAHPGKGLPDSAGSGLASISSP